MRTARKGVSQKRGEGVGVDQAPKFLRPFAVVVLVLVVAVAGHSLWSVKRCV